VRVRGGRLLEAQLRERDDEVQAARETGRAEAEELRAVVADAEGKVAALEGAHIGVILAMQELQVRRQLRAKPSTLTTVFELRANPLTWIPTRYLWLGPSWPQAALVGAERLHEQRKAEGERERAMHGEAVGALLRALEAAGQQADAARQKDAQVLPPSCYTIAQHI
jgi:hypothetical protein